VRRRTRTVSFLWLILVLFAFASALKVDAQDWTSCKVNGRWYPRNSCECQGTCGSSSNSTYSGPSDADVRAERERAERKRAEELQRQMERERLEREAEERRAQAEFQREVDRMKGELKGVSHDDMGLKGVGDNTSFFGLKGVSSSEASAQIKTASPDSSRRDVSTASKQLMCAANITNYALKHALNIVSGSGSSADLDEIKYLSGEATNALQGNPIGVQCDSGGSLVFTRAPDPKAITPAFKRAMDAVVRDSEKLYGVQQQSVEIYKKLADAKNQVEDPNSGGKDAAPEKQSPTPQSTQQQQAPKSTGDSAANKAYAEQKAWQQKDQEKVNQVYEQQKKIQQPQFDALAVLRKAQAELNAVNSQKVADTQALTSDVKKVQEALAGNVEQQ
jgi:hypothetical protein